ncbi:unnamed protein product [Cyprideis torosa]|uniref:Uncharacterized protein n=1 Tax=Cyprideis torosa TaxID=163714 RepID=A0A7R8WFN1_9CRUS|nr:unnamed protein product [Cyprideis torosa]CAG0891642.1 unnamed protein product [Cyprideis torosa]
MKPGVVEEGTCSPGTKECWKNRGVVEERRSGLGTEDCWSHGVMGPEMPHPREIPAEQNCCDRCDPKTNERKCQGFGVHFVMLGKILQYRVFWLARCLSHCYLCAKLGVYWRIIQYKPWIYELQGEFQTLTTRSMCYLSSYNVADRTKGEKHEDFLRRMEMKEKRKNVPDKLWMIKKGKFPPGLPIEEVVMESKIHSPRRSSWVILIVGAMVRSRNDPSEAMREEAHLDLQNDPRAATFVGPTGNRTIDLVFSNTPPLCIKNVESIERRQLQVWSTWDLGGEEEETEEPSIKLEVLKIFEIKIKRLASYGFDSIAPYINAQELIEIYRVKTIFVKKALRISRRESATLALHICDTTTLAIDLKEQDGIEFKEETWSKYMDHRREREENYIIGDEVFFDAERIPRQPPTPTFSFIEIWKVPLEFPLQMLEVFIHFSLKISFKLISCFLQS